MSQKKTTRAARFAAPPSKPDASTTEASATEVSSEATRAGRSEVVYELPERPAAKGEPKALPVPISRAALKQEARPERSAATAGPELSGGIAPTSSYVLVNDPPWPADIKAIAPLPLSVLIAALQLA